MIVENSVSMRHINSKSPIDIYDQSIRDAATKLEATFLTEMLKSASIGESPTTFGGGVGEDQFGSFLRDAQALEIARAGGVGLADALYKSMKENHGV